MKKYLYILPLIIVLSACASFNNQFDSSKKQGIKITNTTLAEKTIYLKFLIPGLSEKDARNSGTKYTLRPLSSKVYYLPIGTEVVATDGVYWDNPHPQTPKEKDILVVKEEIISNVDIEFLLFD